MLPLGKVKEVERMLAESKLSQRKIAGAIGVSRGVVSAIARGARPDYTARILAREERAVPQGPIERCPTCGARVYMPCRLCRVRQLKAQEEQHLGVLRRRARQQTMERFVAALQKANRRRPALLER